MRCFFLVRGRVFRLVDSKVSPPEDDSLLRLLVGCWEGVVRLIDVVLLF